MAAYQTDEYAQLTFKDIQAGEPGPFELHRGVLFYTFTPPIMPVASTSPPSQACESA